VPSAIAMTPFGSANPTGYTGANNTLGAAIQTLWSKEILFQSMPILRFEQFAVKKTELGVQPGLQINFMRYLNLPQAGPLVEGVRMQTNAIAATQYQIIVQEQGFAVALSELLLNASFDDVMATASRLLGRNMAQYLDYSARNTLLLASSVLYGSTTPTGARTPVSPYDDGTVATNRIGLNGEYFFRNSLVKDAVETLASKNVPRLGETYVCFVDPHQSRHLRDDPEWIEVTKFVAPGNFMLGEIGRINDVVFIETTQINQIPNDASSTYVGTPTSPAVHQSIIVGDNAFGHAISLPVELRDGGILDFGREHALAWYAIWGFGLITDQACCILETN
jgi:N4-gp56 family major capsid protein